MQLRVNVPRGSVSQTCSGVVWLWVSSEAGGIRPSASTKLPMLWFFNRVGSPCVATLMAVHGITVCSSFNYEFFSLGQLVAVIGIGCVPCVGKGWRCEPGARLAVIWFSSSTTPLFSLALPPWQLFAQCPCTFLFRLTAGWVCYTIFLAPRSMWDFHLGWGSSAPSQVRKNHRKWCFSVGICWLSKAEQPQREVLISTWFCWNVVDSLPSPLSFPCFTSRTNRTSSPGLSEAMNPSWPHSPAAAPGAFWKVYTLLLNPLWKSREQNSAQAQREPFPSDLWVQPRRRMESFSSNTVWAWPSFQRLCALESQGLAGLALLLSASHIAEVTALIMLRVWWGPGPPQRGTAGGTVRACWLLPSPHLFCWFLSHLHKHCSRGLFPLLMEIMVAAVSPCWK